MALLPSRPLEPVFWNSVVPTTVLLEVPKNKYNLASLREYSNLFCLTTEKLKKSRDDVLIIHPGPVNRGIEIALDVMEGPRSLILNQVTNGVAVRMALLYLLLGGGHEDLN